MAGWLASCIELVVAAADRSAGIYIYSHGWVGGTMAMDTQVCCVYAWACMHLRAVWMSVGLKSSRDRRIGGGR